jgi:hypothetical protein
MTIRMIRPPWEQLASLTGYIACSCGSTLQSREQTREHWQAGHMDEVAPGIDAEEVIRQFAYRLNAMEHAAQAKDPAEAGYAAKRRAVLEFVRALARTRDDAWCWCPHARTVTATGLGVWVHADCHGVVQRLVGDRLVQAPIDR